MSRLLPACVASAFLAACSSTEPRHAWRSLFDGKSLGEWRSTDFGGQGAVQIEAERILLDAGSPLTGIHWSGAAPMRLDYELELRAERVDGNDFFCCLTFPVGDSHLSLVIGGWGGSLCGISSLDERDAANNETMRMMALKDAHPYRVGIRVRAQRLECFLDGERVVDVSLAGRKLSTRPEVLASRPLGVCSFATRAAIDQIRWRPLSPR